MQVRAEDNLTPEQVKEIGDVIQHQRGHFLSSWLFCNKSVCRRARKCSFDPYFCLAQVGPSVPQDVRNAVDAMIVAQFQGKSFDEMLAETQDQLAPYCKWLEKVAELEEKTRTRKRLTAQKPPELSAS